MYRLINDDCLKAMKDIPDRSVDLILTDPPHGTVTDIGNAENVKHGMKGKTNWDNVLDYELMWEQINRVLRKNGKCVLFSQEPFTSDLIKSATPNVPFNYRSIWIKDHFANSLIAKKAPVNYYEDICIFQKHFESENNDDNPCKEYAVKIFEYIGKPYSELKNFYKNNNLSHFYSSGKQFRLCTEETYKNLIKDFNIDKMEGFAEYETLKKMNRDYKDTFKSTFNLWQGGKYKSNVFNYKKDYDGFHPTQKPVTLLEDLIKTYSNENDLILDFTMGSGSTGVACKNTNRKFIGIELDKHYFKIASDRINEKN